MGKVSLISVLFLFISSFGQGVYADTSEAPVIRTRAGLVRGKSELGVESFKGIPYAAAPVGALRWQAPQRVQPWEGIRDASTFCADCAQAGWPRNSGKLRDNTSEDCLFLNLWKPTINKTQKKLPVMVWIYGGGFVGGGSSYAETSGQQFAKQDVILVSFNYRLGRLGHFAFPALSKENPTELKGSYAYMDQIAALKWVQQNIEAFGGDPNNVTIFGESAGGVSVHSLMTIPSAKGLFQKAIVQSGGGRDGVLTGRPISKENASIHYPVSAEAIGVNFARKQGIEGIDADALSKLRALSVEEIVDGGQEHYEGIPIYSGPILDGKLVVVTAEQAYKRGSQHEVALMIGSNSAEVSGGFVNARSKEELLDLFGSYRQEAIAAYDPTGQTDFTEMLTMVNTDKVWAEPARFTARAFSEKGYPAYVYLYSYVAEAMKSRMRYGASHASEIPYVFNTLSVRNGASVSNKDQIVASMLNTYWANFAKTGNPNDKDLPNWPIHQKEKGGIMEFTDSGIGIGRQDPQKLRLDLMEKISEELIFDKK